MIIIARGQIDVKPIIGAVVVFGIIGAVIFGIYYLGIAKPAEEALKRSKESAFSQVNSLISIGTSQALLDASTYSAQIREAGSEADVESIKNEVSIAIVREQKRDELLELVDTATNGTYYSATGASGTTQVQALADLSQTLKAEINEKQEKSELVEYEAGINSQATSTWRTILTGAIENITDNKIEMWKNSPASGGYLSKDNALAYVAGEMETWETLRKLKFKEASTVEVPVLDTFQRTPTIKPNSIVNIYVHDIATDTMSELWTNVTVRNVIYSQADIATIAWTLTDGITSQSYSVNMWETIKAAAAGDAEAAAVGWSSYGSDLMDRALTANIGSYTVSVIYMVEVPDEIGENIMQYELHMTATKDVILVAIV